MKCVDKECEYREFNSGDDISDFYYCKWCGITVERGQEECLIDQFEKEDDYEENSRDRQLRKTRKRICRRHSWI